MLTIRPGTEADAEDIAELFALIAGERVHSAIDRPFTASEQRDYISSLSAREGIFIAENQENEMVGFQTLEAWARSIHSMRHVAQLGTFLPRDSRRQGIGSALFTHTAAFARRAGYTKLVIQVRASNSAALAFYRKLGFEPAGRLRRQVMIDGVEDDELLFELFL